MRVDNVGSRKGIYNPKWSNGFRKKRFFGRLAFLLCVLSCLVVLTPYIQQFHNAEKIRCVRNMAEKVVSNLSVETFASTGEYLLVGSGMEYKTISEAVSDAKDGDTIFVLPGNYIESVKAANKTLRIVGADRDKCVLSYPNGDYHNPPLEMASGVLANMKIKATAQPLQNGAIAKAYCMHTDFNISSNAAFLIENVSFVNDDYQVVGIGLRENFKLHFKRTASSSVF